MCTEKLTFSGTYRQTGQDTLEEVKTRDLRRELEEKERDVRVKRGREKPRSFTGECGAVKQLIF